MFELYLNLRLNAEIFPDVGSNATLTVVSCPGEILVKDCVETGKVIVRSFVALERFEFEEM